VLEDQFGHFKHGDLRFASKQLLQGGISVDVALLVLVLETVLLDVGPDLLHHFGAGHGTTTDHSGQGGIWLHGLHKLSIWLSGHNVNY
jgi:hypothetical protein